jgi:hypothetical protein
MYKRLIISVVILFAVNVYTQEWKKYPYQPSESALSFPYDEGFHFVEPVEWLYICGHLTGKNTGEDYSFILSYFYFPAYGFDGFRIFNLANETSQQFYDESLPCIYDTIAEDSLNLKATVGYITTHSEQWTTLNDASGKMIPFQYHISAESQAGGIDINCNTVKRPLIVADSGFLYQGNTTYSYYYSQTMIDISGILSINSVEDTIYGTGWIDHQYGNFNPYNGEEYEWFCVQLDNGMDLNIWNIFTENNKIPDTSTYRICSVYVNDSSSFTTTDIKIERLKFAYTPDRVKCYSQKWKLSLDTFDINLLISSVNPASEVELPFRFFEGSTIIEGTVNGLNVEGKGFAELLHSYEKPDFSIINPQDNDIWEMQEPVEWKLNNPDEGNPIQYNIKISYDRGNTFLNIANALRDTFYYWNPLYFTEDTIVKLLLTAYSVDSTLTDSSEITLKINPVPNDYLLCAGDSISLFISTGNNDAFEYQWQKNGINITGAADSMYTLNDIQNENSGSYKCIISNELFKDTTVTFDLYVSQVFKTDINRSICENDSIYAGGKWQNTAGIYYDTLYSVSGCDSVVITSLSIKICDLETDELLANKLKVLPNPASKILFIEFNNYFKGNIDIISSYGKILRTEYIDNSNRIAIDLSDFVKGMYLIRFRNNKYHKSIKILIVN